MKSTASLLSTLVFSILALTSVASNEFLIYKTAENFVIDGNLTEWQNTPSTEVFLNHANGTQGTSSAKAQMLWDNNNLYIAFTVTDSDVTSNYTSADDPLYNNDDLVEMFFDFDGSGTNYLELGVNATGVKYDFNIIVLEPWVADFGVQI